MLGGLRSSSVDGGECGELLRGLELLKLLCGVLREVRVDDGVVGGRVVERGLMCHQQYWKVGSGSEIGSEHCVHLIMCDECDGIVCDVCDDL